MVNAAIDEKQNRPGTAIRYYRDIIEEIGDDRDYESQKKEAQNAIKNINRVTQANNMFCYCASIFDCTDHMKLCHVSPRPCSERLVL